MAESDGAERAPVKGPEAGSDIVRRALAVLDEEVRAWLGSPPAAPDEGDDR